MFELTIGYVIGMLSGYIVFRSSVVQAHEELKQYLDSYREGLVDGVLNHKSD